ncbi:MAG TPA: type II toxin-antitoxin system VapC family toxin [Geminicoccaceae bacterium]|nr:type II toxin-antitoxin system VapC family toxin [Geminicoccaceae bacterium]
MNLLLDSHALLWWMDDNPRLGPTARKMICGAASISVGSASIREIAIKTSLGKLSVDVDELLANIRRDGFDLLPITAADCLAVARLPRHYDDPFDPYADRPGVRTWLDAGQRRPECRCPTAR